MRYGSLKIFVTDFVGRLYHGYTDFTMYIFGYEIGGKISLSVYADIYAYRGYKRMHVSV